MLIEGRIKSLGDKGFELFNRTHIDAEGYDYAPFIKDGIFINYGKKHLNIKRYTGASMPSLFKEYLGKDLKLDVEKKTINKKIKTEFGDIKRKEMKLILNEIGV